MNTTNQKQITVKKGAVIEDNFCEKHTVQEDFEATVITKQDDYYVCHNTMFKSGLEKSLGAIGQSIFVHQSDTISKPDGYNGVDGDYGELDFYIENQPILTEEEQQEQLDIPVVSESVFDKAVKHVQETYCDVHLSTPYMLLGDVAELIKITTGKEVDWNVLAKYSR